MSQRPTRRHRHATGEIGILAQHIRWSWTGKKVEDQAITAYRNLDFAQVGVSNIHLDLASMIDQQSTRFPCAGRDSQVERDRGIHFVCLWSMAHIGVPVP